MILAAPVVGPSVVEEWTVYDLAECTGVNTRLFTLMHTGRIMANMLVHARG